MSWAERGSRGQGLPSRSRYSYRERPKATIQGKHYYGASIIPAKEGRMALSNVGKYQRWEKEKREGVLNQWQQSSASKAMHANANTIMKAENQAEMRNIAAALGEIKMIRPTTERSSNVGTGRPAQYRTKPLKEEEADYI